MVQTDFKGIREIPQDVLRRVSQPAGKTGNCGLLYKVKEKTSMKRMIGFLALTLVVILSAQAARAHHSFDAEFDRNKPITKTGVVTRIDFLNPHTWFYLNVKNEDGTVTNWGFETIAPFNLQKGGWMRDTVKPGDELAVSGSQAKGGLTKGHAEKVTLVKTGQKLLGDE
jgi:hypothetical protein